MKESNERERLLKSVKSNYSTNEIPAVHPRYGGVYNNLYHSKSENQNSLGTRIIISLILFLLYMAVEQGYLTDIPITTDQIIEQIELPFYVTPNFDYL